MTSPSPKAAATRISCRQPAPCRRSVAGNDGSYTCSFRVNVTGAAGNPAPDKSKTLTDTVTASAVDTVGNAFAPTDTAEVTVDDVKPAATVVKTASPASCAESEVPCDVTFTVEDHERLGEQRPTHVLVDLRLALWRSDRGRRTDQVDHLLRTAVLGFGCQLQLRVRGRHRRQCQRFVHRYGRSDRDRRRRQRSEAE